MQRLLGTAEFSYSIKIRWQGAHATAWGRSLGDWGRQPPAVELPAGSGRDAVPRGPRSGTRLGDFVHPWGLFNPEGGPTVGWGNPGGVPFTALKKLKVKKRARVTAVDNYLKSLI